MEQGYCLIQFYWTHLILKLNRRWSKFRDGSALCICRQATWLFIKKIGPLDPRISACLAYIRRGIVISNLRVWEQLMPLHRSFKQVRYLIQLDIIGTYNDLSGTRTFAPIIWWWVQMFCCQISHGMNQLKVMPPYMLLENNASFCYVRKSSDVTWMNVYYCVIMSNQQWSVDWGKHVEYIYLV